MLTQPCQHIYKNVNTAICPFCEQSTNEINWVEQKQLKAEWKKNNPNAKYGGWWSI